MQRYIVTLAAVASCVSAQSASATPSLIGAVVPVGQPCTPGGTMCALGASCYSTNSGLQTICGNFQAQCTSNQQCAFNTCSNGFCSGVIASSSAAASSTPSPIGAVVPVGQPCTPGGTMCALGASCYSTNSGLQTICGNFQAQCTSNQQCAFNTCNNGFCSGVLSSNSASGMSSAAKTSMASSAQASSAKASGASSMAAASSAKASGAASTPAPVAPTTGSGSTATKTGGAVAPTFSAAGSMLKTEISGLVALVMAAIAL